ncbi:exopolysaccharide production repressor protein [Ensifer sp. BR816]|uniref:exopolysaccharide production repressor protein n=1 Tax=Rhizobium sp. (strain BR816) TaxID=1057002 RepID=UPI0035290013
MVYFVSYSIRRVLVTTFAGWLLLQVAYFAGVLFLVWRSSCAQRSAQRAKHFRNCEEVLYQSQVHHEGDN